MFPPCGLRVMRVMRGMWEELVRGDEVAGDKMWDLRGFVKSVDVLWDWMDERRMVWKEF